MLRNQKGVTIIAVFFVLLMLGALGMTVSKLTQSQQLQSAKAIQVQDAYYNARSGIEWAYQKCYDLGPAVCNSGEFFSSLNPGVLQIFAIGNKTLEFTLTFNGNAITSTASVGDGERAITFATFGENFSPDADDSNNHSCSLGDISGDLPDLFAGGGLNSEPTLEDIALPWPDATFIPDNGVPYTNYTYDDTANETIHELDPESPDYGASEFYMDEFKAKDSADFVIDAAQSSTGLLNIYVDGDMKFENSTATITGPVEIHVDKMFECKESTITINGPVTIFVENNGRHDEIKFGNNCVLNITGSVNFIGNKKVKFKNNTEVNIDPNSSMLVMSNDELKVDQGVEINKGGDPADVLLISNENLKLEENSDVSAGMYAEDKLHIHNNSTFTGAAVYGGEGDFNLDRITINEVENAGQTVYGDPDAIDCSAGYT